MLVINEKCSSEIVNIGSGENHSIKEFARTICEETGFDLNRIRFDSSKPFGAKLKYLDIEKMKSMHPDYRALELKEGIKEVVKWMLDNADRMIG